MHAVAPLLYDCACMHDTHKQQRMSHCTKYLTSGFLQELFVGLKECLYQRLRRLQTREHGDRTKHGSCHIFSEERVGSDVERQLTLHKFGGLYAPVPVVHAKERLPRHILRTWVMSGGSDDAGMVGP